MSNKETGDSLRFSWHRAPFKEKAAICVLALLWTFFAFGLGLLAAEKNDRAPIIIEGCTGLE